MNKMDDFNENSSKLPSPEISASDDFLEIGIRKVEKNVFVDQGAGMMDGQGCISNPGGPSC